MGWLIKYRTPRADSLEDYPTGRQFGDYPTGRPSGRLSQEDLVEVEMVAPKLASVIPSRDLFDPMAFAFLTGRQNPKAHRLSDRLGS